MDEHRGHEIGNPERSYQLLRSSDIVFCEWCLGNAVWYSHRRLSSQRLVVRLHLQEMRLPYLDQVAWDNVDALIVICPLNRDRILQRYPFLRGRTHLVYNPVDTTRLAQPKLPGAEFNLGLLGMCPRRKAPDLAIKILEQLKQRDRRYTLFIKGRSPRDYDWLWQRPEERLYYEKLFSDLARSPHADSVVLENYDDDVALWFSKIGFILSTSEFEGSHQSVAEGMASGTIPVIRNWEGADRLYPRRFIFSTADHAVRLVTRIRQPGSYSREGEVVTRWAASRFHQDRIISQLDWLVSPAGQHPDPALLAARKRAARPGKNIAVTL